MADSETITIAVTVTRETAALAIQAISIANHRNDRTRKHMKAEDFAAICSHGTLDLESLAAMLLEDVAGTQISSTYSEVMRDLLFRRGYDVRP